MCKSKFIDSSKFNVNVYTEIMNVIDNNVYAGVFNVKNIINTILSCKKYKVRLIPLIKSIELNLSQQIDFRKGNLYNYIYIQFNRIIISYYYIPIKSFEILGHITAILR